MNPGAPGAPSVRVFLAVSLDGFLAGPGDDLSWLPTDVDLGAYGFAPFLEEVGALLMGRRTYDVVAAMGGAWPYGDRPVLVATHRPMAPAAAAAGDVRAVQGSIGALLRQARAAAGDRAVYLDGGALIRAALDAGLPLDMTLTVITLRLGSGVPLFGTGSKRALRLRHATALDQGLVQLRYDAPAGAPASDQA